MEPFASKAPPPNAPPSKAHLPKPQLGKLDPPLVEPLKEEQPKDVLLKNTVKPLKNTVKPSVLRSNETAGTGDTLPEKVKKLSSTIKEAADVSHLS